jgi:RHS repeat-associated protein
MYGTNGAWDVSDFYPFGGERVVIANSNNRFKFTGKERDSESGLDNFSARYLGSSLGRFMSPDPANIAGELNESDSPQSWNTYSYTHNNPLIAVDRSGLDCVYLSGDYKSARVRTGECKSETDDGIFVDGTVTSLTLAVTSQGDTLNIGFQPNDGSGVVLHPEDLGEGAAGLSTGIYNYVPKLESGPKLAMAGVGVMALPKLLEGAGKIVPKLPPQVIIGAAIVAALAYGGYQAHIYFSSEQSLIREIAREYGIDAKRLGDAIHATKRQRGMGGADNLTADEIREIAEEIRQGLWLGTE